MRAAVALIVLVGCGRIGFDARASDGALGGDETDPDAAPVTDPFTPWGTPTKVDLGFSGIIDFASLTRDELEIAYERGTMIVLAKRATRDEPFSAPVDIGTAVMAGDISPRFSADSLTLYFASDRPGTVGNHDVYAASRPTRADSFDTFMHIDGISTAAEERWLEVCAIDGVDVSRYMLTATGMTSDDLYEGTSPTFIFSAQDLQLSAQNAADFAPHYADNCTTVYFASTRVDGKADLYVTTRASLAAPWDPPQPITSLNIPAIDDEDPWVSPDGHRIYFHSTREHSEGDLFMAER